jgi:UDP-N-acetylmuramate dehydrogenase
MLLSPDEPSLPDVIADLRRQQIPYTVLGRGTNVLVRDAGIEGAVILTASMKKSSLSDGGVARVQSGMALQAFIVSAVRAGFSGMEGLAGIPGSIGGAVAGNAGSFGYEMKDVVASCSVLMPDGSMRTVQGGHMGFGYRKAGLPEGAVIVSSEIALKKDDPVETHTRFRSFMKEKKAGQPVWQRSAGCVFKNPHGLSAGRLIDEAGCKGMSSGGISVSAVHANFFVNNGGGTAGDFLSLIDAVSQRVHHAFGVILEPEIRVIGR